MMGFVCDCMCVLSGTVTDLLLRLHSWERAGQSNRYTCLVWSRSHRHTNSCRLLERGTGERGDWIDSFICHIFCYTQWHKEGLRMELTNNTLVPSRQRLPAWTAVWMEARATHIGPDRDKEEKTNKLTTHPDLPNFSKTPQQIHTCIIFLSCPRLAWTFRLR